MRNDMMTTRVRHGTPLSTGAATGTPGAALSHRDRAILRAVDGGSAELVLGAVPALYLDGRCCSDQFAARGLAHAGLIAAAGSGRTGQRVRARLTVAGRACLAGGAAGGRQTSTNQHSAGRSSR